MVAKARSKQPRLLHLPAAEGQTQRLFHDWQYDLPDEEQYNAKRAQDGLFKLTDAEVEALNEAEEKQ
jgi:hypothetical protein